GREARHPKRAHIFCSNQVSQPWIGDRQAIIGKITSRITQKACHGYYPGGIETRVDVGGNGNQIGNRHLLLLLGGRADSDNVTEPRAVTLISHTLRAYRSPTL